MPCSASTAAAAACTAAATARPWVLAPLKENLAAGLIRLTEWDGSTPLVDPCCGSGILLIEAALTALQQCARPAASLRWRAHHADFDQELWELIWVRSRSRTRQREHTPLPPIVGFEQDQDPSRIKRGTTSEPQDLRHASPSAPVTFWISLPESPGVLVCNPPYGHRIGDEQQLEGLYRDLGTYAKQNAAGWQLWLLSGNRSLTGALRLKASKRIPVSNGGIDCRWLHYGLRAPSSEQAATP